MNDKDYISDDELKKQFPLLFSQSKEEDFEVPEGYFEKLPSLIMSKIQESDESKVIHINRAKSFRRLALFSGIAAAFLIAFFIFKTPSSPPAIVKMDPLEGIDAQQISIEELSEFDEDIIYEALLPEELEQVELDEEYEDYFYDNDIDIEEIIYAL